MQVDTEQVEHNQQAGYLEFDVEHGLTALRVRGVDGTGAIVDESYTPLSVLQHLFYYSSVMFCAGAIFAKGWASSSRKTPIEAVLHSPAARCVKYSGEVV